MPRRPAHPSLTRLTPLRIATQILTLQLAFYAIAATLILFTSLSAGKPFSLDLVVNWQSLRGDTVVGWTLGLCWVLSSVFGYVHPLSLLVLWALGRCTLGRRRGGAEFWVSMRGAGEITGLEREDSINGLTA